MGHQKTRKEGETEVVVCPECDGSIMGHQDATIRGTIGEGNCILYHTECVNKEDHYELEYYM